MHDMQEEQTSRGARDGASVRPITIIDHRALVRINAVTIMTRVEKKVDAELRRRRQGHTNGRESVQPECRGPWLL